MITTMTSAMTAALAGNWPSLGVYVEFGFTTPLRIHDRTGTRTWNSLNWVSANVTVSNITYDDNAVSRCDLDIIDADSSITQQVLTYDVGAPVKVWLYESSATAATDPELLISGSLLNFNGTSARQLRVTVGEVDVWLPRLLVNTVVPAMMFNVTPVVFRYGSTGSLDLTVAALRASASS